MSDDESFADYENVSGPARFLKGRGWTATVSLIALLLLAPLICVGWTKYGRYVPADRFRLEAGNIDLTSVPDWIQSDIITEVMRDGSLDEVSLLDPEATVHIAQAFRLHSWVQDVKRVSKHADGHVEVELEYRQPVGMVKVKGGHFPVDGDGILLPPDLSVTAARRFARIEVGETWPLGSPGTGWGNQRVVGAARIASAFGADWQKLQLHTISTSVDPSSKRKNNRPTYVIRTASDRRIIWGHAPQEEIDTEAPAQDKISRLVEYVRTNGPLDELDENTEIDLRSRKTIRVSQRVPSVETMQSR